NGDHPIPTRFAPCPNHRRETVYAAVLLMSSVTGAGDEVIPAGGWGEGPRVAHAGGCTGTPARASLLDRIHARPSSSSSGSCCAPAPCASVAPPVPVPAPAPVAAAAPCCDSCGSGGGHHASMLDKIKSRGHPRKGPSCCAADPCGAAPVAPGTGTGTTPPKE